MIIRANAKINLTLDIKRKRSDGYHDLSTVMQSLSLCDMVELSKNKTGEIIITSNKRTVPTDSSNTAYKAAKAIMDYAGINDMGVNIYIEKIIPMEAGMGGGSADAAAVVLGMINLFSLEITESVLMEIATGIGADVPFCLYGGTCVCEGIGEELTRVAPMPDCSILVCKPPVGVSTPEAYNESDKYPQEDNFMTPYMVGALDSGSVEEVADCISNRFDDILHIPEVQIIKSLMRENGAINACMTGSGSAVYGIYNDEVSILNAAELLKEYGEVFLTKPVATVNKINS